MHVNIFDMMQLSSLIRNEGMPQKDLMSSQSVVCHTDRPSI